MAVFFDKWWTRRSKPLGLLLCPADHGGQEVTVRAGRLTVHFEAHAFLQRRRNETRVSTRNKAR